MRKDLPSLAERMAKVKKDIEQEPQKIKETKKVEPKLFISGRLNRKKHKYTAHSIIILDNLKAEINAYCKGGDLAVLNYLLIEGLKNVKEREASLSIECQDIENNFKSDIT